MMGKIVLFRMHANNPQRLLRNILNKGIVRKNRIPQRHNTAKI